MRKIYKPVTSLATVRAKLGLTQEQMALQLGVSKSMVKMVETGKRSLPNDIHIKLAHIEITLTTIPPSARDQLVRMLETAGTTPGEQQAKNIRGGHPDRSYKIFMLEQKLRRMQQQYNGIAAILQNLHSLIYHSSAETGERISQLIHCHEEHLKKFANSGPQQQKLMRQIAILKVVDDTAIEKMNE